MSDLTISSQPAALVQPSRSGVTAVMTATQDPGLLTVRNDLNDTEWEVLKAAVTGTLVDRRTGNPHLDNPAFGADWSENRTLRTDFLADLLTGDLPTSTGRLRAVKLCGARVTGTLDLEARKLLCPVLLRDCYFDEAVNLEEAEAVSIRFPGCHVPGLNADQLRTVGNVELNDGFTARGQAWLVGARIGGQLDLSGAILTTDNGPVLNADGLIVGQSMFCLDSFAARGGIRLVGASIGAQLNFRGASLTSAQGPALNASGLTVDQTMFCNRGFAARGEIRLAGAHIGGQLDLKGASLANDSGPALNAYGFSVDQHMFCDDGFTAQGGVDLTNAKVGMLHDNQGSWPEKVWIRDFVYEGFGNQSVGTRARLQWLRRHDESFTPQIYDQLADVYRRAGDDGAARKVAVAKQWRRRKPYNPLSWLWWVTVGYGYRTWQAFIWAAALTIVGALVFSGAYPTHMVKVTAHPPRFQPVIYALDVLLPIGGLGQKSAWQATGGYLDCYWGLAIAGWVLSAAVVAGLTGILKRD